MIFVGIVTIRKEEKHELFCKKKRDLEEIGYYGK